ncbi:hypothetical protein FSP39_022106 [Pinctada imbricata]|uniref:Uncharacterized protein n=1 Tax=Pinctada imbricata TaxID=66713 RepID=A0AA88YWL3_PINIB|nr:hypothetical protein FSP39_022106 [Pinctada imbricata]
MLTRSGHLAPPLACKGMLSLVLCVSAVEIIVRIFFNSLICINKHLLTFPSSRCSDYVNDWDEPFDFQCPNHGYINGFRSVHYNNKEDRRIKFRFCNLPGICVYNCQRTGWVNNYGEEVLHTVPVAQILHGVKSIHDNYIEYVHVIDNIDIYTISYECTSNDLHLL